MHRIHKLWGKKIAYILWALFSIISLGTLIVVATNSDNGIPDDVPQTLGNAFVKILGNNWETNDFVRKTMQLGGFTGSLYVQSTTWFACGQTSTGAYKFLTNINRSGTYSCNAQQSSTLRIKAILATIRDVDVACTGSVKINGTPIGTTDAQDIREWDKLETGGCSMSSLYFVDHSIVRLAANTTITLRSAWTPSWSGTTDVTLNQGELWARVLKPITDDSYFNISSQEGSVGVRGTSVYVGRNTSSGTLDAIALDSGTLPSPTSSLWVMTLLASGAIRQESIPIAKYVQMKESTLRANQYINTRKDARINRDSGIINSTEYINKIDAADDAFYGIQDIREIPSSTMTKTPDIIYSGNEFVRLATLADLKDWDDLYRFDRGNLKVISMTGSWLRTNSGAIRTGSGYTNLPTNSINPTETKVLDEFTRTEPTWNTSEINALCPWQGKYISKYIGCLNPGDYWVDFTDTNNANYNILNYTGGIYAQELDRIFDAPTSTGYTYTSSGTNWSRLLQYPLKDLSGSTITIYPWKYPSTRWQVITYIECTDSVMRTNTRKIIGTEPIEQSFFSTVIQWNTCTLTLGRNSDITPLGDSSIFKWSIRSFIIHYVPQPSWSVATHG